MKTASLSDLKKELQELPPDKILELCIGLAKYKKENKELLTYLLFEAHNEQAYIESIKTETNFLFTEINKSNVYFAKKGLRKILRIITKYIKYSGSKQTEVELLIYFCNKLKNSGIPLDSNTVISNIYNRQLEKINTSLSKMHEDLRYDYQKDLEDLIIK